VQALPALAALVFCLLLPGSAPRNSVQIKMIGVSIQNARSPFYQAMVAAMWSEMPSLKTRSYLIVKDARRDSVEQQAQVEDFIRDRVDAIILAPVDSEEINPAILEANVANIPVFLTDIRSTGGEGDVKSTVTSDNLDGGYAAAQQICKTVGREKTVVILDEPGITSVADRVKGFRRAIERCGFSQPADDGAGSADADAGTLKTDASSTLTSILHENRQVGAVFGINDDVALGGVDALARAGSQSTVVGYDASNEGVDAVNQREIFADVVQYAQCLGSITIQEIGRFLEETPKGQRAFRQDVLVPIGIYTRAHQTRRSIRSVSSIVREGKRTTRKQLQCA
jgi:ribose transport system substrate-binding protein